MKKILLLSILALAINFVAFSQSNQYIHFDGDDDYVRVDNASSLIANGNSMSMTGWFNPDVLQYGAGMMGFRGEGTGTGAFYILQLSNGKVEFRLVTNTGTYDVPNPDGTLAANQWQHIAFVYNGSTVEAFVNGISVGSTNASGVINSTDKPFGIGKSIAPSFNFLYPGKADELTLWSKALTQSEIMDMMNNELIGNEANLELYFKCDQGFPNGDNTSISSLKNELGNGLLDGTLNNLALTGNNSNFGGTLEAGVQAISFPQISNKLTEDAPFILNAESTSGLEISYEIVSGPASVSGNELTLDGPAGFVTVRAKQNGNTTYGSADPIESTFQVIDPYTELCTIDIRNPLNLPVYSPNLDPIELASIIDINFTELLTVSDVQFFVNGEKVGIKDWGNKHYTGWWTPPSYGSYTFEVIAKNNYGASISETVNFTLTETASDINIDAFTNAWVYSDIPSVIKTGSLPSYVGAFDQISATLDIVCPTGGCDPWDRVSRVEAKGHNGEWFEIIRYLTPYGVACNHEIDLTDFMSLLQGKIDFRVSLGTQGNGFVYNLNLEYRAGTPSQKYSSIQKLWSQTYQFGDYADLQPCETYNINFEENTSAATIKLVSTGHGWDVNFNTGNAAEFHEDTHHILVDGVQTFTQHNWLDCNPNPDNCSPQNGTWTFDRAGWCPGSIAPWFTFDMTPFVNNGSSELKYIFDENYIDLCHPNHPNCVTGTTCSNCDQGFNPHLIVSSYLVSKSNMPFNTDTTYVSINEVNENDIAVYLYPNPSAGKFVVDLNEAVASEIEIKIYDYIGNEISPKFSKKMENGAQYDISNLAKGVYIVVVSDGKNSSSRMLVLE